MKLHQEVQIGIQILFKYSRPSFKSAVNSARLIIWSSFVSQVRKGGWMPRKCAHSEYIIVDEITTRFSIFKIRCVSRKRILRLKMPMKMERQYDKKDTPMYTEHRWTLACPRRIRDASAYCTTELQHKIRTICTPVSSSSQTGWFWSIDRWIWRTVLCIAFNECA